MRRPGAPPGRPLRVLLVEDSEKARYPTTVAGLSPRARGAG